MSSSTTSYPKNKIRVLLLENIHSTAQDLFTTEQFQIECVKGALKEQELQEKLAQVHVLGIRSKTQVSRATLESAKNLLAVGAFCIGTNQIDLEAANHSGIPVFNAPFSNTRSVAELILGELVMLARQLGDRSREVHAGQWRKVSSGCYELRGKTLGIVGYGHIGSQVGVLAESFGMRVLFFDVASKLPLGNVKSCSSLKELVSSSDFVTLHVPATPQTENMIGKQELAAFKKGSYLLNASRGSVVHIPSLVETLKGGHLSGAAIDVFPEEPETNSDSFQSDLRGLSNVILTPHIGGSTEEAQANIGREVATSLIKYINAGVTAGAVNFPQVDPPAVKGTHRILNVHRNVPGVLRDINRIVSDLNANIRSQVLSTDQNIGYLVMDLDQDVSGQVKQALTELKTSIRTRILY